ncbi:hypothetical protein E4U42_005853 [Claviceps africana]|uniref:Peptidase A1 domain-containing protein n=1 Tax=Claviceps africana TaxID=83212 RepID=A0A8K0J336_9HYPO|nr:hypothetical protein E4U42_005853 [Claviceps africana]
MRLTRFVARLSAPLLVLSGQAAAKTKAHLEVTPIQKVTDPAQGGFRPFVEFTVAGQVMKGLLDTGSSDWIIPRTGSAFCKGAGEQCDGLRTGFKAGSFDMAQAGAQVRDLEQPLSAKYTGGASFGGRFIQAPLRLSSKGKPITVQMGLIESGGVPQGQVSFPVLGVGPVDGECAPVRYANVPAQFKESGRTKVNAFGLFLGDFRSAHSGSIVWGGYDAAKFDGKLKTAPLVKNKNGAVSSFVVNLSSIRLTSSTGSPVRGASTQANPRRQRSSENLYQESSGISSRSEDAEVPDTESMSIAPTLFGRFKGKSSYKHLLTGMTSKAIFRREQSGNILTNDAPQVVTLDTGVPQIIVPQGTLQKLKQLLGAQTGPQGDFLVDCQRIVGMDLVFGMNKEEIQIRVPLDSIMPSNAPTRAGGALGRRSGDDGANQTPGHEQDGNGWVGIASGKANVGGGSGGSYGAGSGGTCSLLLGAVTAQGGGNAVLGAPALQHMYAIFDMDSKAVLMAQAKVDETRVDLREYIPAGRALAN